MAGTMSPDDMLPANPDGFPDDVGDIVGAKGTGPTGEAERDDADDDLMTDEDYRNAISGAITAAEFYIDDQVTPDRELAAKYYLAEPFGNEEKGRSAAVSPEVRGAVLGHMPGLMRMFCGTERYVEFAENPGTPYQQAQAQTDQILHVIESDNNGYMEFQSAIDNALRRKTGILTWWWEEREMVTLTPFSGLNEDALALLEMEAADKSDNDEKLSYEVEITDRQEDETQDGGGLVPEAFAQAGAEDQAAMEAAGMAPPKTYVYAGVLRKRIIRARARFRSVPPEEFIVTPTNSSNLDSYPLIGTREEKTISELVALGHDEAEIRELIGGSGDAGQSNSLATNPDRMNRNEQANLERIFDTSFSDVDPASERVKYCVVYVLIDRDGDGIAERRKICTVGENNEIIYDEIYDDDNVPFGVGCPYPEPHSPFGMSVADMAMDIQEIKSEVIRGTLDSLAESIVSRVAFRQGSVNIDDLLNPARGAAIRTTDVPSNVIQNLSSQFVGANSLPIIQYIDEERNKRTGTNPASPTGFDPDSTQSTAREAIGSMIDASQERTEYIARNLAEMMFRPLFLGIRNLLLRHQDHRRLIRLNGTDVAMDPRTWNATLDVRVLVGTGRSSTTKRQMALKEVLMMQREVYTQYGPNNPMVTLQHIGNTTTDLLRAMGFQATDRYFATVTPEMEQGLREMAAEAAKKPTPEMMLAQIQMDKNEKDFAAKMAQITNARDAAILKDDQARDKAEQDWSLGVAKILGDYGIKINEAEVRRHMAEDQASTAMVDNAMADKSEAEVAKDNGGGQK